MYIAYENAALRIQNNFFNGDLVYNRVTEDDFEDADEERLASPAVATQQITPQMIGIFSRLFDIRWKASVHTNDDGIQSVKMKKRSGYANLLHKGLARDYTKPRLTSRRVFLTDGIRLYQIFNDWEDRRGRAEPKYLTEIRRTSREKLGGQDDDDDLFDQYGGVIGLDFGEAYAAASVFQPSNPDIPGSQLLIKRGYLYGRTIKNSLWLQKRKSEQGISMLEQRLQQGSTRSDWNHYMLYLRALKQENTGIQLFEFYSNPSVRRRNFDNFMSQRSCLDKACFLIMNQGVQGLQSADMQHNIQDPGDDEQPSDAAMLTASSGKDSDITMAAHSSETAMSIDDIPQPSSSKSPIPVKVAKPSTKKETSDTDSDEDPQEASRRRRLQIASKKFIYAFGLDGLSTKARKGSLPPVDNKLARALLQLISAVRPQDALTRVDEYMSSKICSSCIKLGNSVVTSYFRRAPHLPVRNPAKLDSQGRVEIFRLVHCNGDNGCGKVLHRDGNAASNLATAAKCILKYRQRPQCFIRPSRRLAI